MQSLWEEETLDDLVTPAIPARCQYGQLWQCGSSRLLIGDSTNTSDVARLLDGVAVQAVITDPPYGEIHSQWDQVTYAFIPLLKNHCLDNATVALFCKLPFGFTLHKHMEEAGYVFRWDMIWAKNNAGFKVSSKQPRPGHEHIFAYCPGATKPSKLIFNGWQAGEKLHVWRSTNLSHKGETREVYVRPDRDYSAGRADGQRWLRSVVQAESKPNMPVDERTTHPTQKPLSLLLTLVTALSHEDTSVYDPFGGSGTTLAACERLKRRCYLMERETGYGDIILDRYERQSGQQAYLI